MLKALLILTSVLSAAERPLIFPEPQKMNATGSAFRLTESVPLVVSTPARPADLALVRQLVAEVSDRYGRMHAPRAVRLRHGLPPMNTRSTKT
jgi:hypothetical protein